MAKSETERLTELLLQRIEDAGAKVRLEQLLRSRKDGSGIKRATGTYADLRPVIAEYVASGELPLATIAALVDSIEANGAQHIFLFKLTDAGRAFVTRQRVLRSFPNPPAQPTEAMYAALPSQSRMLAYERAGSLYVKQIYRAEFWERSDEDSHETENVRTIVYHKERRRALNVLVVDPRTGAIEIRIDRVRTAMDDKVAMREFEQFIERIRPVILIPEHVEPVAIWEGFNAMVRCRDETFMTVDDAADATIRHRLASRRGDRFAMDIRDHEAYDMTKDDYARDSLSMYWEHQGQRFHTIVSRVAWRAEVPLGKVYVSARLEEAALDHVIGRIRSFAPEAS